MRKYLYRTVSLLFIISTIFTNTTPVFAEKVRFDITIGSGGNDPKSKRGSKADSEQKYYVRSDYFSRDGYYYANSRRLSDGKAASGVVYIASDYEKLQWSGNASYGWYAESGIYYYLYGWTSGTKLRTKGYYNP